MECLIDRHDANTVLVGKLHRGIHRLEGHGRAELAIRVPRLGGSEAAGLFFNFSAGHAAGVGGIARAEVVVEVQRLKRVVRLDAVP